MQSDTVYVACWFQKYAKNQLKTEFLSKKTLLGKNDAKSPKILEFLAYASCPPCQQSDNDCVGSYFTQPNTFS